MGVPPWDDLFLPCPVQVLSPQPLLEYVLHRRCFSRLQINSGNGDLAYFKQRDEDAAARARHMEEQAWAGGGGRGARPQVMICCYVFSCPQQLNR